GAPFVKPNLRGNQRGIFAMALFENIKQQTSNFLIYRVIPPFIDKQDGIVLKAFDDSRLGMISLGMHEQVQEFTEINEIAAIALVYCMDQKGGGKASLAAARGAYEDQFLPFGEIPRGVIEFEHEFLLELGLLVKGKCLHDKEFRDVGFFDASQSGCFLLQAVFLRQDVG